MFEFISVKFIVRHLQILVKQWCFHCDILCVTWYVTKLSEVLRDDSRTLLWFISSYRNYRQTFGQVPLQYISYDVPVSFEWYVFGSLLEYTIQFLVKINKCVRDLWRNLHESEFFLAFICKPIVFEKHKISLHLVKMVVAHPTPWERQLIVHDIKKRQNNLKWKF